MDSPINIQWLKSCTGVELHILPDGSVSCRRCSISLQKDNLTIDEKTETEGTLSDILKKIPSDKPVALTLTGKGILTKRLEREDNLSTAKILQVFPSIKPEQFYIQNFVSAELSFLSIVRKEIVDEIIDSFKTADKNVLLVNLGPFAVSHVLKQLNFYGDEVRFDGHSINLSEGQNWKEYQYSPAFKSEFPLKIDIEPIAEHYLLAYAAAFQLALYPKLHPVTVPVQIVEDSLENFRHRQVFNFRAAVVLGVFFVLLLLNFLLFSYYSDKNEALFAQVSQNSVGIENLQQTQSEITRGEKLLQELGWYKGIPHAWLWDQLGKTAPPGLRLKEVSINPIDNIESNRQRRDVYNLGTIEINGETTEMEAVNAWMELLKEASWVERVSLKSFSPSAENDSQLFSLILKY